MKIRIYNENGVTRIVEVTNKGTEITIFGSVIDGELAELVMKDNVLDCHESLIQKIK